MVIFSGGRLRQKGLRYRMCDVHTLDVHNPTVLIRHQLPYSVMSFSERISSLQSSAERQLHALGSRKKTENALILPFFNMLGYNPFDVREVEPEYEIGHGEQATKMVDYAIKEEGTPIVLLQCAEAKTDLDAYEDEARGEGFLFEYFGELEADVAAFTNGLTYRFYADLETSIRTEEHPFLEFNLLDYESDEIQDLRRLSKPAFDKEKILSAAHDLQTSQLLRSYFARQRESPDDHLVRFLAAQVYEGEISGSQLDRFRPLVQKVLEEFIGGDGEGAPPSEQETPSRSDRTEEPDASGREDDSERSSLGDEIPVDEDDENGTGPFDKDLAQRVIDDF
ncbi:MAG: hypothetical protein BRD41_07485 [Bacteroidetes bacterium QS_1_63_11]|nr:MAG: hypothetical protein BRD41_07485 [Bacteroidetes bacterium QS_1_63_11]